MSERKALTLEELRDMDGRAVKGVYDEAAKETTPGFMPKEKIFLVESVKAAGCVVLRNNVGEEYEYYSNEELKQDGLTVYKYDLPRLNREAWEPCESCVSCDNCEHAMLDECEYPCHVCIAESRDNYKLPFFDAVGYCKDCGRPLTEEAWAMLEKRLEGILHETA